MFSKKNKTEICIPVLLDEPLTSDSCTKLIIELLKYILYQKQQIPFAYDSLVQLQKAFKPMDRNSGPMKTVISSLRVISDNLNLQLCPDSCNVREVVIIIGVTALSPKLCIRLELPATILSSHNHIEHHHSSRRPLLNLMRSIIGCEEFQEAMAMPLGPTNTFVLLQKRDSSSTSNFFLPKPRYALPLQTTICIVIKLTNKSEMEMNCNCENMIKVYHDLSHDEAHENSNSKHCNDYVEKSLTNSEYSWYQSQEVIKGFKFLR